MKKTYSLGVAALLMIAMLASCATTTSQEVEQIPSAPAAVPAAPAAEPQKASATTEKNSASEKTVQETKAPAPQKAAEEAGLTLAEQIAMADASSISVDDALAIAEQLLDPANDPDGKLTQEALAKAEEIVTSLIDGATSEEEIDSYIDLMNQGMEAYGSYVNALGIDVKPFLDMAQERKVAIEAYNKNSYYYYLKQYRKDGRYKKELSSLLAQKNAK